MSKNSLLNSTFLPNFCSASTLFIVVVVAELFAAVLFFARLGVLQDYLFNFAMQSLFIQWIALTSTALLCLFRRVAVKIGDAATVFFAYLLVLLNVLVITELAWWFLYFLPRDTLFFSALHGRLLLQSLGIAAIAAAAILYYLYVQHQWHCRNKLAEQTRLQALQSRIRPHFLFNCMNTIASLTRTQPALAERAIEDLADLFRASLADPNISSCLRDELDLCKGYLHIEQQRLGKRLTVEWDIDTLPMDARLPLLILQPLLENAIYHGIELIERGGTIHIEGVRKGDLLYIKVANPLPQDDQQVHMGEGYRLAQENIRQRLRFFYGTAADMQVEQTTAYYRITFCFPYQLDADLDR